MQKKIVISIGVVALLLMGIMATSVLASDLTLSKNTAVSRLQIVSKTDMPEKLDSIRELSLASINPDNSSTISIPDIVEEQLEIDVDKIRSIVPDTFEETDSQLSTQRTRFLLYTHDGKYVMWGFVGNGHFVGTDNMGKRCWGIYGRGIFAGFYDGEFFWGKYRGGNWKAEGLFGLNPAHGKYILFPTVDITPAITAANP